MILIKEFFNNKPIKFYFDIKSKRVIVETCKTSVMCHLVISSEEISGSFSNSGCIPLTVYFEPRFNAIDKIPGGFKKKDLASDFDIVLSRLIDRCIRPLVPNDFNRDIRLFVQVLSYNQFSIEVLSVLASSLVLYLFGVISFPVSLCKISGQEINAPNKKDVKFRFLAAFFSQLSTVNEHLTQNIMIDYECLKGLKLEDIDSYRNILDKAFKITSRCAEDVNKLQLKVISEVRSHQDYKNVEQIAIPYVGFWARRGAWSLSKKIFNTFFSLEEYDRKLRSFDSACKNDYVYSSYVRELVSYRFVDYVLRYKKRLDSRPLFNSSSLQTDVDIRETSLIKSLVFSKNGCNLFSRGGTEVVSSICLADVSNAQCIDSLDGKFSEFLIINYNFLPHLNQANKKVAGSSRREIGHSELIKKALKCLILDTSKTIRIVSDVVACDGSSSMSAVCGASILLYQNHLISELVAGISIGLINHEDKKHFIVDLTQIEDEFLSLIDCKIAGTKHAITAIQLDSKKIGLTYEDFKELLKISVVKLTEVLNSIEDLLISKDSQNKDWNAFNESKLRISYDFDSPIDEKRSLKEDIKDSRSNYSKKKRSNDDIQGSLNKKADVYKKNAKKPFLDEKKDQLIFNKKFPETIVLYIDANFFRDSLMKKDISIGWLAKKLHTDIRVEGRDKLRVSAFSASELDSAVKFIKHLIKN